MYEKWLTIHQIGVIKKQNKSIEKARERHQRLSEVEKDAVVKSTETFLRMKNKSWLSIEKKNLKY